MMRPVILALMCGCLISAPVQAAPPSAADQQTLDYLRTLDPSRRTLREEEPQRLAANADHVRKLHHSILVNLAGRGWRKYTFVPLEDDLTNLVMAYEYVFLAHLKSQNAFIFAQIKIGNPGYLWIDDRTGQIDWFRAVPYISPDGERMLEVSTSSEGERRLHTARRDLSSGFFRAWTDANWRWPPGYRPFRVMSTEITSWSPVALTETYYETEEDFRSGRDLKTWAGSLTP